MSVIFRLENKTKVSEVMEFVRVCLISSRPKPGFVDSKYVYKRKCIRSLFTLAHNDGMLVFEGKREFALWNLHSFEKANGFNSHILRDETEKNVEEGPPFSKHQNYSDD